jgi:hypothetical protein
MATWRSGYAAVCEFCVGRLPLSRHVPLSAICSCKIVSLAPLRAEPFRLVPSRSLAIPVAIWTRSVLRRGQYGKSTMTDENEHVQQLIAARDQAVKVRREVAHSLSESYRRGHTEDLHDLFVKLQNTIEAIDRAIADERSLIAFGERAFGPVIKVGADNQPSGASEKP